MKPLKGDQQLQSVSLSYSVTLQALKPKPSPRRRRGLDASPDRDLTERSGEVFLLDILSHRMSVIAFHEKAGRSQVDSSLASLNKVFCSPAEWPLSPCFHPHSRGAIRFARCVLGVLDSAGAAICLAPCGSALSEWNLGQAINAVTGTRLWAFVLNASQSISNGNQTIALIPTVPLAGGAQYTVKVAGVQDFSGNILSAPVTSSFTTGSSADLTPPKVASSSASGSATGVSTTAAVQ